MGVHVDGNFFFLPIPQSHYHGSFSKQPGMFGEFVSTAVFPAAHKRRKRQAETSEHRTPAKARSTGSDPSSPLTSGVPWASDWP